LKKLLYILSLILFSTVVAKAQTDTIRYVSTSGSYQNDGRSWATAKDNVQDAINDLRQYMRQNNLQSGSVYIAQGTYVPSESTESNGGSISNTSFKIYSGMHIYGGFQGTESSPDERIMRNGKTWTENLASRPDVGVADSSQVSSFWNFKYPTVLSGNHSTVDIRFTFDSIRGRYNTAFPANSYHVVWFATNGEITTASDSLARHFMPLQVPAFVNGCTIRGGNASNRTTSRREHTSYGGGAYMVGNSSLLNCVIYECAASLRGGGVYMDGGGTVDYCYIHTSEVTGVGIVQGYGGAVCIDYDGAVKHSFLTQSTARIGGGLAICHVPNEYPWKERVRQQYGREPVASDQISYYYPFASACVISNNTTNAEGGGVYLDEGGTINHCTIVRNKCIGPDVTYYGRRHGRSGGIYIRNCGMMYNSVCWGNECTYNNDMQFASVLQKQDADHQIYIYHSGFMNNDITDWSNTLKDMVYSIEKSNLPISGVKAANYACFSKPSDYAGVLTQKIEAGATVEAYPQVYPEYYPLARWWHPLAYTSLAEKGVQVTDAIQGASRWIRHAHTATDVVGNFFEAVSSLGAMVRANEKIKYALISPQGKESRSGDQTPIPTLFVDPSRTPKFDEGELVPFDTTGCSWDDPLSTIGDALEYFKLYVVDDVLNGEIVNHHYRMPSLTTPGEYVNYDYVQILVKEGTVTTAGRGNYLGTELRTAAVRLLSHLRLYGSYPSTLTGTVTEGRNPSNHFTKITANISGGNDSLAFANNSAHVVCFVNTEHTIVDGFRLYDGNTHNIQATASVHAGGCVLVNNAVADPQKRIDMLGNQLRNCVLANCTAPKGAAIYVNGEYAKPNGEISCAELIVENCIIRNNTADYIGKDHGVITANGRAFISVDHCDVVNNVGYPFKADNKTTVFEEAPEQDLPYHGYIQVSNTIIFANSHQAFDNRGNLNSENVFSVNDATNNNYVFGAYNLLDFDAPMPKGFVEGFTPSVADVCYTVPLLTVKNNERKLTRVSRSDANYPAFKNPARNIGHSIGGDKPLYGGVINYFPMNVNPCVNSASPESMSGYDRSDQTRRTYGGAADIGAIEDTNLPILGKVVYVTPDGAGKRDGSSWGDAIAGNTVYQLSSVAGPALAAGDQIDSEPTCDRVLDSEGNPVLTTNEKYNGGWGRAYLTSKTESVTTTLTTDADVTETVIYTGGGPNDRTETLAPYHETKSDVTTISSGTPGGFTPGYDYLVTYPYGEISGASRSFWRANPYTGTLATYGNSSPASFIAACNANGWINNTRAERYVSGLQYAVERASETNALYHKDSVQVWVGAGKYTDYKGFVMRDTVTVLGGFPAGKYATPGLSERQALMSDVISIPKSKPAKDFDATDYETILQISDVNPKQDNTHLNDSAVKYWDDDYAADIITDTETIQTATITRTTTYTWETASEEVTSTYIRYADMLYKAPSTNVFAKATRNRVDREGNIIKNHITMTNEVFGGLNWTEGQLVVYQFFGPAKSTSNPWPDANGNRSWELAYEDRSNNVDYNVWGFDASRDVLDAGGSKIGTVPRGMLLQGVMNTMSVWQTLKNVPAGDYKLEIDLGAYYTRFVNDENTGITFYILTSNGNTVAQQAVYCKDDKLRRYEFSFTQPADGDIIIRMMSESGSHATDPAGNFSTSSNNWRKVCMANVHLFWLTGQNYVPSEPVDVTTVTSSSAPQVKTYALYTPATHRTTLRKRVLTMPDVCVPTYGGGGIGDPVVMGNAFSNDALPHTDRVKGATKALRTAATLAKQEDPHYVEYNDANWDGFTIRHGFLYDEAMAHGGGSGVNMYEGAHLRNCIVIHNMSACRNVKGGGIFCDGATSTIEGCFVLDNTSTQGTQVLQGQIFAGGMFMYEGTCFNSLFANNYSYGSAGGLGFCVGRFFNNTVAYNTATLVENGSISGGAISLATSSNPNLFVANTIIYGNNGVAIRDRNTAYGNVNPFIHCYIQSEVKQPYDATNRNVGNYGTKTGSNDNYGVNNIYINGEAPTKYNTPFEADLSPLTGEYTGNAQLYNDYRLLNKGDSSCVNHGIDEFGETFYTALRNKGKSDTDIRNSFIYQIVDTAELPQNDVAFADRVQDCQIDIGAYEYNGAKNIVPDTTTHPGYAIFYVSHNGAYNGNASADSPNNAACKAKLQKVLDAAGRYKYALMTDSRYAVVAAEPVAGEPDKSWTVQVRIAGDEAGNTNPDTIPDTYTPTRSTKYDDINIEDNVLDYSFIIPHGVQVLGGYSPGFYHYANDEYPYWPYPDEGFWIVDERDPLQFRTIFTGNVVSHTGSAGQAYHVVTFTNNLYGTNEYRIGEGDQLNTAEFYTEENRAVIDGIYLTDGEANSPDFDDRIGGAAVVTDFAHVRNCIVANNTAEGYGGGLYLKPGALVSGTIVKNNSATIGGGIYVEQPLTTETDTAYVISTTVCDNFANTRAGGLWFDSSVRINSCAFWHNTANDNANIAGQFALTAAGYPVVYSGVEVNKLEGQGNIELSAIESEGVRWSHQDPFDKMVYYPIEMSSTLARAGMTYDAWKELKKTFITLDSTDIAGVSRLSWNINGYKRSAVWDNDTLACKYNDLIEMGARAYNGTFEIKVDMERVMYRIFVVHTDFFRHFREVALALQNNKDADLIVNNANREQVENALMYRQMGSCYLNPYHRLQDAFDYIIKIRKGNPEQYRNTRFEVYVSGGEFTPMHNAYGAESNIRTHTFTVPEGVSVIGSIDGLRNGHSYCQAGYRDPYNDITRINQTNDISIPLTVEGIDTTIVLNNVLTDTIRRSRPTTDYNFNSVIEPWEYSQQSVLSGYTVNNQQETHLYHVITCFADSMQLGGQPFKYRNYNEETQHFSNIINPADTALFDEECEQSKVARSIILDGLSITGGYANSLDAADAAKYEYLKKTYFRGGGIFVDGNWTEDFDDPNNPFIPNVTDPANYDLPLIVRNCQFHDNVAGNGGAIYSNGTLNVYGSHFTQNYSIGPVTELDTQYIPWSAGGCIATNDYCGVNNCLFANNEAMRGNYPISVSGDEKIDDAEPRQGFAGVISSAKNSQVRAVNCDFVKNKAVAFPAIFNFLFNTRYNNPDERHFAFNCIFWGNEATGIPTNAQNVADSTRTYFMEHYDFMKNNVAKIDTTSERFYNQWFEYYKTCYTARNSSSIPEDAPTKTGFKSYIHTKKSTATDSALVAELRHAALDSMRALANNNMILYFCSFDEGTMVENTVPLEGWLQHPEEEATYTDFRAKQVPLKANGTIDFTDLFTFLRGDHNIILSRNNRSLAGPNFIEPSTIAGIDGYMQNADWLFSRINSLTDAGWGWLKQKAFQNVDHYELDNDEEQALPPDLRQKITPEVWETLEESAQQDWFPVYALEDARFLETPTQALYNYYANHYETEFNFPYMPVNDERYMLYTREGNNSQKHMDRISANPRLGIDSVYIDMGIYEYQYVQLQIPGNEIDTVWVTTEEDPSVVADGTTWEKATSNVQDAIDMLLRSHNNHDKYVCFREGVYAPTKPVNNRLAYFVQVPTEYIMLPSSARTDVDYSVKSISFLGGWSNTAKENGRNAESTPSVFRMENIRQQEMINQLFVINDMTKINMRRTFRANILERDTTVIPIVFDGLQFENRYSRAELESEKLNERGGAAIYYRYQRRYDDEDEIINIIDTIPLYPAREKVVEGDTIELPKLTISNCVFANNGAHTDDQRYRSPAVRIEDGGGYSLIVNSLFHSNAGRPVFAPNPTNINRGKLAETPNYVVVVNSTFALNDRPITLENNLSQVHNSLIWKDDLLNDTLTQLVIGSNLWQKRLSAPQADGAVTNNAMFEVDFSLDQNSNEALSTVNNDVFNGPNFVNPDETATLDSMVFARDFHLKPAVKTMNMADTTIYRSLVFSKKYPTVPPISYWARALGLKHDVLSVRNDSDLACKPRLLGNGMERGAYECQAVLQRILYVHHTIKSDGVSDGSSWRNAFSLDALQDAIDVAAVYTYMNRNVANEESRRSYVFVKGSSEAQDLNLRIIPRDGVNVYGSIEQNFGDTAMIDPVEGQYTDIECQRYLNLVRAKHLGIVSPMAERTLINGIKAEEADKFKNAFLLDGFQITQANADQPTIILKDSLIALRNCVITGNTNTSPIVDLKAGLIYNTLFYGNNTSTMIKLGEKGLVLNCTVVAENEGELPINSETDLTTRVLHTIAVNKATDNTDMFAPYTNQGYFTNLPQFITSHQPLHYQLVETSNLINLVDTASYASLATINEQFEPWLGYVINFGLDRDILGNPRTLGGRLDHGAFETWRIGVEADNMNVLATNKTNPVLADAEGATETDFRKAYTLNYGGNAFPHRGSVLYIMNNANLLLDTDAGNPCFEDDNPLRPGYTYLATGASLYGQGNYIKAQYVAADRHFNNQRYAMVSMPFLLQHTHPTLLAYHYNGTTRSEHNYRFMIDNSTAWERIMTDTIEASMGWLADFGKTLIDSTIRFTGWANQQTQYAYTEGGNYKIVTLNQYDHRTPGNNGEQMQFTRKEDMGWNMRGIPYLVTNYRTDDPDDDEYFNMHIPHIFYKMGDDGTYLKNNQIYTAQSWAEGETLSLNEAFFTQTATVGQTEDLYFRLPQYAGPAAVRRSPRPLVLLKNTEGDTDILRVEPDENAQQQVTYNLGRDGVKWQTKDMPQLYMLSSDNTRLSLAGSVPVETDLPLGISLPKYEDMPQGKMTYTFSLPERDAYQDYTYVWIIDKAKNRTINLQETDYQVTLQDGEQNKRFLLRFGGVPIGTPDNRQYIIYTYGGMLYIRGLISGDKITVYSASGQMLNSLTVEGPEYSQPLPVQGGYVIRVNDYNKTVVNL